MILRSISVNHFFLKYKTDRESVFVKVHACNVSESYMSAIPLEIVANLITQRFILCFKSFFLSRRDKSRRSFTENGQTVLGAAVELKILFNNG